METSAKGLRVLVTAGAAGIGFAIAKTFAEHGARVHICDVDDQALGAAKKALPGVTQTRADVASRDDVERLFKDAQRPLGGLDVLVNNAGIAGPTAKVEGDRVERVIEAKSKGLGIGNDEMRRRLLESVSLRTMVSSQDVANTALFLATDAGRHISGQSISVCGGVRYMV